MGGDVDDGYFARSGEIGVAAQRLRVASLGDVLSTKLLALNEQEPDLSSVLELARSLREQIDWDFVRDRTAASPFARVLHARRGARRRRAAGRRLADPGLAEAGSGVELEGRAGELAANRHGPHGGRLAAGGGGDHGLILAQTHRSSARRLAAGKSARR